MRVGQTHNHSPTQSLLQTPVIDSCKRRTGLVHVEISPKGLSPTQDEQPMSLLDVLSIEAVLLHVLAHLGFQSTVALGSCCKRLHTSVLSDTHIWRTFFHRAYPPPPLSGAPQPHRISDNSSNNTGREPHPRSASEQPPRKHMHAHGHAPDFTVPYSATQRDFSHLVTSPVARHLSNCATMHELLAKLNFRAIFSLCMPLTAAVPQPFAVLGGMHAFGAAVEMEMEEDLGAPSRPLDSLTNLPWPILGAQWRREPVLRQLQMPNAQRSRRAADGLPWLYRCVHFISLSKQHFVSHVAC